MAPRKSQIGQKNARIFPGKRAKPRRLPAIWENFDDFKTIAMDNHKAALALKDAALSKDGNAVMALCKALALHAKAVIPAIRRNSQKTGWAAET